jgi:hypothetical protein
MGKMCQFKQDFRVSIHSNHLFLTPSKVAKQLKNRYRRLAELYWR